MKKFIGTICVALCLLLVFPFITACANDSLEYNGVELAAGKVGMEYSESVAFAEADGDAAITYALKENSKLPDGLTLSPDGNIYGVPATKSSSAIIFTIVARADGYKAAEAEFRISSVAAGTLAFGDTLPRAAVNTPYVGTIDVIGAGGAITYTLAGGEMPSGLTFDNGVITGTPTVLNEEKFFSVTASSKDCASVTAEFGIKVILPWLDYESFAIEKARQDVEYGESIAAAKAKTEDVTITYALKPGSTLPSGLTMDKEGYISGTPTVAGPAVKFIVVASAPGYSPSEATFSLVVRKPIVVEGEGVITYGAVKIESGYLNEAYHVKEVDLRKAIASNGATVTYALKAGSSLPTGLIFQSGKIRPGVGANAKLTQVGEHIFTVVASAKDCPDAEATFSITVLPERLIYLTKNVDTATVGEPFAFSVATATKRDGTTSGIKYALKADGSMPAGLVIDENGLVTGTPVKSAKEARFTVTASADGYTSVDEYFYIHIRDKIAVVSNGVFEAEYINLIGLTGEGWSGNAYDENVIQNESASASNGYYIGWTFCANAYAFQITSDKTVSGASLKVGLASEIGNVTITPAAFDVRVNGVSVPYGSFRLTGASGSMGEFQDYTITANGLNLIEGQNTIELIIRENALMGGRTFGPGMDCIKIGNVGSAMLSWRPCTYNLDRFAEA